MVVFFPQPRVMRARALSRHPEMLHDAGHASLWPRQKASDRRGIPTRGWRYNASLRTRRMTQS